MHDPNHNPYDLQGYEPTAVPYIPYPPDPAAPNEPRVSDTDPTLYKFNATPQPFLTESMANTATTDAMSIAPTELAQPSRRKGRRGLWLALAIIAAVLIVGSLSAFAIISYINRPTPAKTLDAFCRALQREDYQLAYNQFSKQMQGQFSEPDFADILAQDKVVSCTHGSADEGGKSATTDLKLVHNSKGVNQDKVTLTKDSNNEWKIDNLQKA